MILEMKDENIIINESNQDIKRTSFINKDIYHIKQSTNNGKLNIYINLELLFKNTVP